MQEHATLKEIVQDEREAHRKGRRSEEENGSLVAVGCPALHASNGQGRNGIELMMDHIDRCMGLVSQESQFLNPITAVTKTPNNVLMAG